MAGKKVIISTTITQLSKNGQVKPISPVWQIYNDGETFVFINKSFLPPGRSFGIGAEAVVAQCIEKGIEVVNDTQYYIELEEQVGRRRSAQLIEVFIKIQ
jgi:hypothetical protein